EGPPRRLQGFESGPRTLQLVLPTLSILFFLLRTAIPQHPVTFRTPSRALHALKQESGAIAASGVCFPMHFSPSDRLTLQLLPKPSILRARTRHHGQKPSFLRSNVLHVV